MARELPSFIIPPPARPMSKEPLWFLLGAAVGAGVYHFMRGQPAAAAQPAVKPPPTDRFTVQAPGTRDKMPVIIDSTARPTPGPTGGNI
jgi:hypothetical protein